MPRRQLIWIPAIRNSDNIMNSYKEAERHHHLVEVRLAVAMEAVMAAMAVMEIMEAATAAVAEAVICAATCCVSIRSANVWEGIFAHAYK